MQVLQSRQLKFGEAWRGPSSQNLIFEPAFAFMFASKPTGAYLVIDSRQCE